MRLTAPPARWIALAAVAATVLLAGAPSAGAATWQPCTDAIVTADCASFELPLDRSGVLPGTTTVRAIKIAAAEGPRMGTMFVVAGGPGQTSGVMLDLVGGLFAGANRYDLVAVDQRGSGTSEPLNCPRLEAGTYNWIGGDPKTDRPITDCSIALGPARAAYNTAEAVADLEAVRADLGVPNATIFGISYGSKVALAYAKAHPDHTKALLLDSVVPTDMPVAFDLDAAAALRGALAEICDGGSCRGIAGSTAANLTKLAARLAERPLEIDLEIPGAKPLKLKIDDDALYNVVFAADFNNFVYSQLPSTLSSALRGDNAQLKRLARTVLAPISAGARSRDAAALAQFSYTMYLATSCADLDPPWARGDDVTGRQSAIEAAAAAIPDGQFAPFARETVRDNSLASYCRGWQQSPAPPPIPSGPLPEIPTLALDGSLDLRTPVSWAERATAGNPRAQVVKIPNTGHSTISTDASGCALSLAKRFLTYGGTDGVCKSYARPVPVAPRPATSLRRVKPLPGRCRGFGGARCQRARRQLTAGYLGLRDTLDQALIGAMEGGRGIYGGSWSLSYMLADDAETVYPDAIIARGMSSVRGVSFGGELAIDKLPRVSDRVTITGMRRARISGRVAFDRRADSLTLSARTREGSVRLRVRPSLRTTSAAVPTRRFLGLRNAWMRAALPPSGRPLP